MNINEELANLSVTFRGLAENADREASDRQAARERAGEYGQNPAYMPDPEDSKRVAAYWRFHEQTAKSGFLYYSDPPPGAPFPQVAIPQYHAVTTEAIAASRIKYGSSNDPWKFTDVNTPRAPQPTPRAQVTQYPTTRPSAAPAVAAATRGDVKPGKGKGKKGKKGR